jgi:hypothetical protein
MPSQFAQSMIQKIPQLANLNVVAPTFAGITGATPQADGSVLITWGAVSGAYLTPARFRIFCAPGSVSAAVLFSDGNFLEAVSVTATSAKVYVDSLGATLTAGNTYTFGVRAVSTSGITNLNVAILTAVVTYNLYALTSTLVTTAHFDAVIGVPATTVSDAIDSINLETDSILSIKAKTDNLPSNPASQTNVDLIKAKTDNLPSSPASETTVAAVKAKTDNLPADPASETATINVLSMVV